MHKQNDPSTIYVGVVGLGLMGTSIATCLLMAGHPVVGIAPTPADLETARDRIHAHLTKSHQMGLITETADHYLSKLVITEQYNLLQPCLLVVESTLENLAIKQSVFDKIEAIVDDQAIITSNTSAIPITELQKDRHIPARFLGLHWKEPSHTSRFLEIICGDHSDIQYAEWLYELSYHWSKEPTLVRKDIRGFITNRLMYAMFREAFHLVENGYATVEDVDRACRNNPGYWMTLAGVFRWMDLTGVPAYQAVMEELLPSLSNQQDVPKLMRQVVDNGGKGVVNQKGFYEYTEEEARLWRETFEEFDYDIRQLALKYPGNVVEEKIKAAKTASNNPKK
ncbi:3-hydroxybutyryl-CoA dehydrogenase [Dyadobacter jejuensis]|uniref:3-hydroxybutyryl-CoA dehydrogenase n=1 Tax=Dyadobacter jejuensis TaxID=1082580 RepID=A0A316AHM6_9BACT|nr:3-hydroxyacyl-CoA dehydrogenase family protein [Dyadobacter jejuensis]PWJ57245.1 3-hydroxybutyryl-CoA dehydrogenase [Dyadobacter jejuensis]